MFDYDFVITEKCNWNCEYCIFPTISNPKDMDYDRVKHHFDYMMPIIQKLSRYVGVDGGEIGLMEEEELYKFFSHFDSISVATNGLFLERELHKGILRKHIKEILWHVSQDCYPVRVTKYEDKKIEIIPGVVGEWENITDFMILNDHIEFEYHFYDQSIHKKSNVDKKIIEKCQRFHNNIVIDLVNERICLCKRNYGICYIPLTEENFKEIHMKYPVMIFGNDNICDTCSRLCIDKTNNMNIECRIKSRRFL